MRRSTESTVVAQSVLLTRASCRTNDKVPTSSREQEGNLHPISFFTMRSTLTADGTAITRDEPEIAVSSNGD